MILVITDAETIRKVLDCGLSSTLGIGDAVTPGPVPATLKCLLGLPDISFATYPPETVVAEKLEALVRLGLINTRIKDFYDLWVLSRRLDASSTILASAIRATFVRRSTPIPTSPLGRYPTEKPAATSPWSMLATM